MFCPQWLTGLRVLSKRFMYLYICVMQIVTGAVVVARIKEVWSGFTYRAGLIPRYHNGFLDLLTARVN